MKEKDALTRREFIQMGSRAAAAAALSVTTAWAQEHAAETTEHVRATPLTGTDSGEQTPVVLVRNPDVLDANGRPVQAVVDAMMDEGITSLTGVKDPTGAWSSILRPEDTVGIKSNVWQFLPTPGEVERSIKKGVLRAGVPEENIGIDDRGVLHNPIFQKATALINARPMRSHHWAGVGSLIKNYIMFAPEPSDYHTDSCADLAKLWDLPAVKGKTRLNILVMLTPQFHGVGPHSFSPRHVWRYNGLLFGFDPVAVDATGVNIIQARRRAFFKEDRPLDPPPKHIFLADTRHGLGTADPAKIRLIRLGDQTDILL